MKRVKDIKKGEFFKLNESSDIVYIRGDYDRSYKKFDCTRFDDINMYRTFDGNKKVFVDFEF